MADRLSARWQELFWALPSAEMRSKLRALEIDLSALTLRAEIAERERNDAYKFVERQGYWRCDIAACNCNGWHGGHSAQRLTEIGEALSDAGIDMNGLTILDGVKVLIARSVRPEKGQGK